MLFKGLRTSVNETSTKGTIDPEGSRLITYAYGKPRLCINIHHYAPPIGSTAKRAAGSTEHRAATALAAARRCGVSEGSLSSFKSISWKELC